MTIDAAPLIASAAAVAVAAVAVVAGRGLQRWIVRVGAGRSVARRAEGLPLALRLLLPIAVPLAERIGPHLPLRLREQVQRRLRRAGLDEDLLPQHWLSLLVVCAAVPGALAASTVGGAVAPLLAAVVGAAMPGAWLRDRVARRRAEVMRDLPLYLDMITLALEAGGALGVALRVATERAPDSALRRAFLRTQGDLRAGRGRSESLAALGDRLDVPAVRPLVAALVQAESSGGSLATVLRAQADQRIEERFARAEKLALEAPVKMLAPLVFCIFPCTFAILAFPLLMRFLGSD